MVRFYGRIHKDCCNILSLSEGWTPFASQGLVEEARREYSNSLPQNVQETVFRTFPVKATTVGLGLSPGDLGLRTLTCRQAVLWEEEGSHV